MSKEDIEGGVAKFYDECWTELNTLDDSQATNKAYSKWEDVRDCSREYARLCRLRLLRHLPRNGEAMLDAGSGPLLFKEYVEYSRNFDKRYCVDLSAIALREAQKKLGERGLYLQGSILDIPLQNDFFDSAISVLTIFNIHKDEQETAVRRMLQVTKPDAPVIIVYCSEETFPSWLAGWLTGRHRRLRRIAAKQATKPGKVKRERDLYYYRHPVSWWRRFEDVADVEILPWATLDPTVQKTFVPDNKLGSWMLDILFKLEDRFPHFLGRNSTYPMIILRKKLASGDRSKDHLTGPASIVAQKASA
jgi:ubiquinone/menaquinone biosynthesis C-methylase UbiE